VLPVDGDLPAGQVGQRDAVTLALEEQLEALVDHPLPQQPVGEADLPEEVDRAVLQNACTDALLDVLPSLPLEHHRVDAAQVQKVCEHQAGRAGADDRDLGAFS
jgi:hypothetical protein